MTLGICANARGCWPLPSEAYELGLIGNGWARSIVYDIGEFGRALETLPSNVQVCALLNSETAGYNDWDHLVATFARRFKGRVHAVECLNEADLLGIPAKVAVDHLVRAKGALLAAGMRPILTSVAGPNWQSYLSECERLLGIDALGCWAAFHPYGQRAGGYPAGWGFGELDAAVRRANELIGLPIAVTEFGIKVRDAGGEEQQATYIARAAAVFAVLPSNALAFASLFCLGDEMGSPGEQGQDGFGLRREDGSHRPAWTTFSAVNGGPVDVPVIPPPLISPPENRPHYQLGFAQWAAAEPELLGTPLEDERGGVSGLSFQETERGFLTAAYLADPGSTPIDAASGEYRRSQGWCLTFWERSTRARYLFDGSRSWKIA